MKAILRLAETHFYTNSSFCMVETDFLSCRHRFLLFTIFFYKRKPSLKLVETNLFGKNFVPVGRDFLLFRASFLLVETVTKSNWNK